MKTKKWYDDWNVTYRHYDKKIEASVSFPHLVGYQTVVFTHDVYKLPYVKWLIDLIDCLATELSERDKKDK